MARVIPTVRRPRVQRHGPRARSTCHRGHAPSAASSCWGSRCSWARGSVASVSVSGHVAATSSVTCLWASPSGAHVTTGAAWALQDLSVSHLQGRVHGGRGRGAVLERAGAPRLSPPACEAVPSLPRRGARPWLCSLSPSPRQRVSSRARPQPTVQSTVGGRGRCLRLAALADEAAVSWCPLRGGWFRVRLCPSTWGRQAVACDTAKALSEGEQRGHTFVPSFGRH